MKRFEAFINGCQVGFVEALDISGACDVIYKTHSPGASAILHFTRETNAMNVLIDTTNWRALARHDSYTALAALAVIQFANIDTQIIALGANKSWSVFDAEQLAAIAHSVGVDITKKASYPDIIKAVRTAVEELDWLALPYTTDDLKVQAYTIKPEDARPLGFNPGSDEPKILPKWPSEPQRNRKRADSSYWHCFAAGLGYGPGVTTEGTIAHLRGQRAPAPERSQECRSAPPAPPKPKGKPKPLRAPGTPAARPKAGTSTGKVWDVADKLWASFEEKADLKGFRKLVNEACTQEGVNAGTVNVQFGKWKSSKGL